MHELDFDKTCGKIINQEKHNFLLKNLRAPFLVVKLVFFPVLQRIKRRYRLLRKARICTVFDFVVGGLLFDQNVQHRKYRASMESLFVTVGSTSFSALTDFLAQPDVQKALLDCNIAQVTIQYGAHKPRLSSDQKSSDCPTLTTFAYAPSLRKHIQDATLIISHAGAGTILEVIDMGKPLIVVVNSALMNDHQTELATAMNDRNCCRVIRDDAISTDLLQTIADMLQSSRAQANPPRRSRGVFSAIALEELDCSRGA